jgi:hypothetical protein
MHLGTSAVRGFVTTEQLPAVLAAYNKAITSTFYIAAGASACGFFVDLLSEWRSVKGNDVPAKAVTE